MDFELFQIEIKRDIKTYQNKIHHNCLEKYEHRVILWIKIISWE